MGKRKNNFSRLKFSRADMYLNWFYEWEWEVLKGKCISCISGVRACTFFRMHFSVINKWISYKKNLEKDINQKVKKQRYWMHEW